MKISDNSTIKYVILRKIPIKSLYCTSLGHNFNHTGCTTIKWGMYFVNFGPFKYNQNHFFDNFMHKTFAQFILHTFWCIYDAYWCILSTYKKNCHFQPKKFEFFKLNFHAQNIRIIHSAYIMIHFDAFRCILMHFTLIKCYKNHFFDQFVHITFEQFILETFDAFWCTMMHFDAHQCILMHFHISVSYTHLTLPTKRIV